MTGYDVYKRVLNISGYLNNGEVVVGEQSLTQRMPDIINQICQDLDIPQINSLEDSINAASQKIDALCYGTAMLLSLSEGEIEKNRLFTQIYNSKRMTALSKNEQIVDTLPTTSYGVD